ncbi:hypothetical protein PQR02_00015 [Paraburkholderia sediminicola]|uniref:Uncharacterized protein n=1 Tax=Paraburkholderia rhynchosiae TaxID=487049 RepID=A0ACC7NSD6_9BURK
MSKDKIDQLVDAVLADDDAGVNAAEDGLFEVDHQIHAAMKTDDDAIAVDAAHERLRSPDAVVNRLSDVERMVLHMERRVQKLESRINEAREVDREKEKDLLTQRVQSLENSVKLLQRGMLDKAKKVEDLKVQNAIRDGQSMHGWSERQLAKAREAVIEALLEGGERFEWMNAAQIQEYGNGLLDYPSPDRDIEAPDFIVLDALPEVLRSHFMAQFPPVASLIRNDGLPALALARHENWRTFAGTLA